MSEFPVQIARFLQQAGDPGATLLTGKLYTKDNGAGVTKLYYEDSAGVVVPLGDNELLVLFERIGNPPSITDAGQIYTKDVAGITQLFYEADDGTVTQMTPVVAALPNILPLPEIAFVPPTLILTGQLFANTDGVATQGFYVDDLGAVSKFTGAAYWPSVGVGGPGGPRWLSGAGSPEGVVTAPVGSVYSNIAGTPGSTVYFKESGAGNTGWLLLPGGSAQWTSGTGLPEGVVVGSIGDMFTQTNSVGGPVLWIKQSGVATNTGWSALVGMQVALGGGPNIAGQIFLGLDTTTGAVVTGQLHSSNAGIQYSSDRANRAQLRCNQYGPNTGSPGMTTFKSRGAFGLTAAVIANDIIGRWTAIAVSADNASLNLAAFMTFYAQGAPLAAFVPCRAEVELTNLAGVRQLAVLLSSEGELSAKGPIGPGDGTSGGASSGPRWRTSTGSPEGVVVGSVGDLYSDTTGGAGTTLYVKETGVGNTGWAAK